jgi:hypothetical protein
MTKLTDEANHYADQMNKLQKLIGVELTPVDELVRQFVSAKKQARERMLAGVVEHKIIAEMAQRAGSKWKGIYRQNH